MREASFVTITCPDCGTPYRVTGGYEPAITHAPAFHILAVTYGGTDPYSVTVARSDSQPHGRA